MLLYKEILYIREYIIEQGKNYEVNSDNFIIIYRYDLIYFLFLQLNLEFISIKI